MLKSFAVAALAVALTVGCAHAATPTIALIQIDLTNPFHLGEVDGAKEAARREGFNLVVSSGDGDVTKQIQAMENAINQKVDAISINFIDAGAFGPTMAKAKAVPRERPSTGPSISRNRLQPAMPSAAQSRSLRALAAS